MQYVILIPQKLLVELSPGLSLKQAYLLSGLMGMIAKRNFLQTHPGNTPTDTPFVWATTKLIQNQLPLLGYQSQRVIARQLRALVKLGLLRKRQYPGNPKTFWGLGESLLAGLSGKTFNGQGKTSNNQGEPFVGQGEPIVNRSSSADRVQTSNNQGKTSVSHAETSVGQGEPMVNRSSSADHVQTSNNQDETSVSHAEPMVDNLFDKTMSNGDDLLDKTVANDDVADDLLNKTITHKNPLSKAVSNEETLAKKNSIDGEDNLHKKDVPNKMDLTLIKTPLNHGLADAIFSKTLAKKDPLEKAGASKNGLLGFVINKAAVTSTASDVVATIYSKADTSILIAAGNPKFITVDGTATTDIRMSALKKDQSIASLAPESGEGRAAGDDDKSAGTTTKAMPYLQFTTDSSSQGKVETAGIKIEFKAAEANEGKWETVKDLEDELLNKTLAKKDPLDKTVANDDMEDDLVNKTMTNKTLTNKKPGENQALNGACQTCVHTHKNVFPKALNRPFGSTKKCDKTIKNKLSKETTSWQELSWLN